MPQPFPRAGVREQLFEETLRRLIPDTRAADDYVLAAEFVLARDPTLGQRTKDPNVWALPMAPIVSAQMAMDYTFDEKTIYLLALAQRIILSQIVDGDTCAL